MFSVSFEKWRGEPRQAAPPASYARQPYGDTDRQYSLVIPKLPGPGKSWDCGLAQHRGAYSAGTRGAGGEAETAVAATGLGPHD